MALFLKRDTRVFLERVGTNATVIWEIPVLDGFSFTQGNTTSEVTLNEMADGSGNSKRGRRAFNDALAPAEWSISTYVRPFISAGTGNGAADSAARHHAIEEALWAHFVGTGLPQETNDDYNYTIVNITADASDSIIDFAGSGKAELGTFNLYFIMGASGPSAVTYTASSTLEIYKLTGCVVNEATINFEVDGIAMIDWSGNASTLTTVASFNATHGRTDITVITEGVLDTDNFIRNKLTALELTANDVGTMRTAFPGASANGVYNITLTGGSITFSNNITFLTPETLGVVNIPIGHITGNKSISGNFTAYVDSGTPGDSGSLFDAATSVDARSIVTTSFATIFKIGGTTGVPRMEISLPTAHLALPSIQSEDVIAIDVAFEGLPSTITSNDEATITYVGP
jgi:hypothetical protein